MIDMTIKRKTILFLFIIVLTVLPYYFCIGGVSATNLVYIALLFTYCIFCGGKIRPMHMDAGLKVILFAWLCSRLVTYFYHGEYLRALLFWLSFFGIGWVICDYIQSERDITVLLDLIINIAGIVCIIGVFEAVTHINLFAVLNNSGVKLNYNAPRFGLVRIIAFTGQTINYCLYCSIVACITLYRLQNNIGRLRAWVLRAIYALLCLNILLTLSRSIIVCFIISQVMLLWKFGVKKFAGICLALLAAFVVAGTVWSAVTDSENMILQMIYMIMAVFDSSFAEKLSVNWGVEDKSGVGDRLDLYRWVFVSVKNNIWLGMGEKAKFSYQYGRTNGLYSWIQLKQSIEVNFLSLLYHYGIISAVCETMVYLKLCMSSFRNMKRKPLEWEGIISFDYLMFVIMVMELLSWIMVNSEAELFTLYMTMFIYISYSRIRRERRVDL